MSAESSDFAVLLQRWQQGEKGAESVMMSAIYPQLHRLASNSLQRYRTTTWQPTDLLHEAYEKLIHKQHTVFNSQRHFIAIAARVMRRIVVDDCRVRHSQRRGGEASTISLDDANTEQTPYASIRVDSVDIERLLNELRTIDARAAEIVELRFFSGMDVKEMSAALKISERTVKRSWKSARAWLHSQLGNFEAT